MRFSSFQLGNAHVATQEASGAFSPEISGNNNRKKKSIFPMQLQRSINARLMLLKL